MKEQERLLVAEGGKKYVAQRSALQQPQSEITRQMELHAGALRELCAELLLFTLVSECCLELSRSLNREVEIQREQIAGALWVERIAMLEQALAGAEIWEGLELSAAGRQRLIERLKAWLTSSKQGAQATPPACAAPPPGGPRSEEAAPVDPYDPAGHPQGGSGA
ncbi:hypothetical protein A4R35_00565 [Thermogemmatispora tikiterensis]|uniref:Uncharacterized protein n=1 Tax=Thermogemmatispora tikiterensis TaxID=1825093 RepID=A0A328VEN3_9CHLR|nr:hypothetical protein A4R35_00565 [Thermogemmatispora tikiterensis]